MPAFDAKAVRERHAKRATRPLPSPPAIHSDGTVRVTPPATVPPTTDDLPMRKPVMRKIAAKAVSPALYPAGPMPDKRTPRIITHEEARAEKMPPMPAISKREELRHVVLTAMRALADLYRLL